MAINIPLVEGYRLRSDANNFMITKIDGERELFLGFFTSIESALDFFITLKIRSFNSSSVHSLLESLKRLQTALSKALQPLNLKVVPFNSKKYEEAGQ